MNEKKLLSKLAGGNFKNIKFNDFQKLIESFGFKLTRVSGSHHIYTHPKISGILNIQNVKGEAKPYQIKQFLQLIEQYNPGL